MSVYNAVGEGPSSPPQEVFVGEAGEHHLLFRPSTPLPPLETQLQEIRDPGAPPSPPCPPLPGSPPAPHTHDPSHPPVPTAAPRSVAVHSATATQLDVTWEPPPLENQNGDIQGYKVWGAPAGKRAQRVTGALSGVGSDLWVVGERGPQGDTCSLGYSPPIH